ncbi:hypothetical protein [Tardibacter chloracetimidivorans]|nr:hypothetical protein [Tardibacter chloracetimidivorans]
MDGIQHFGECTTYSYPAPSLAERGEPPMTTHSDKADDLVEELGAVSLKDDIKQKWAKTIASQITEKSWNELPQYADYNNNPLGKLDFELAAGAIFAHTMELRYKAAATIKELKAEVESRTAAFNELHRQMGNAQALAATYKDQLDMFLSQKLAAEARAAKAEEALRRIADPHEVTYLEGARFVAREALGEEKA